MTAFTREPSEAQRLDWEIMLNGSVALYFKEPILQEAIAWLKQNGYLIYEFQCGNWGSEAVMHNELKETLKFPDYYGKNLDALSDCLSDLQPPEKGGIALVLHHFDSFAKAAGARTYPHIQRTLAEIVLDIMASTSRYLMLTGGRFLSLVQSDDPESHFERLGCVSAQWNAREWLNKNRGL